MSTKSPTKLFQASPRGSRPVWNKDFSDWMKLPDGRYFKDKIKIIDLGGNHTRLGLLEMYDAFGFDLSGERRKGEAPNKICPECRTVIYASYMKCPNCGHVFPPNEKKDKKKFLDEVGLEEINKDKHFQRMIQNMPTDRVWTLHAGFLRVVALVRGYKPSWVYEALKARGEYVHDGSPEEWAKFYAWIKEREKEKGMTKVYQRMKDRQIKK